MHHKTLTEVADEVFDAVRGFLARSLEPIGAKLAALDDQIRQLTTLCAQRKQLDQAERGFSFRLGGPLDMRMGQNGPTAADVVATATEKQLADIIYIFGEERHSRGVARAIVAATIRQDPDVRFLEPLDAAKAA